MSMEWTTKTQTINSDEVAAWARVMRENGIVAFRFGAMEIELAEDQRFPLWPSSLDEATAEAGGAANLSPEKGETK